MNELEKIKRCMGQPVIKKIKDSFGEEMDFEFHPLGVDSLPEFLELQRRLGGNEENIMIKENAELMVKLIMDMIDVSFPKDTPEDVKKNFAMKNIPILQEALIELNTPTISENKIKTIQDRLKANAKQTPKDKE